MASPPAVRRPFAFPTYPWEDLRFSRVGHEDELRGPRCEDGTGGCLAWTATIYAYGTLLFTLVGATHGIIYVASGIHQYSLTGPDWIMLVFFIIFFAYIEGYRGFHESWNPYVVRRCFLVGQGLSRKQPVRSFIVLILAPFFAAGLFFTSKKRLILSYTLYPMIVAFVLLVVHLPHPQHEIVDVGVALGIGMGTLSFIYHFIYSIYKGILPFDRDARVLLDGMSEPLVGEEYNLE
mmetsp:Transcript_11629/g.22890  ORF Transcript_11629/g.22890 Transcript_11629/m.22890 type:complete len:235 (-) Transcript_11629:144-848(-)|eukprot:CAMPEP_0171577418 /NCGR_PEP_ID=MMETSP0961-20121227/7216_1 /TAXON_ID=87120 /ORGANISM="Aurantiochytrium limacinum, Strain ATCCMYA-1381" /LENGTH=234 /DNA_ID=CAMNT_0012133471 /DNA_START=51 /DNA_END=755 /DNA_ORIENTATION=+